MFNALGLEKNIFERIISEFSSIDGPLESSIDIPTIEITVGGFLRDIYSVHGLFNFIGRINPETTLRIQLKVLIGMGKKHMSGGSFAYNFAPTIKLIFFADNNFIKDIISPSSDINQELYRTVSHEVQHLIKDFLMHTIDMKRQQYQIQRKYISIVGNPNDPDNYNKYFKQKVEMQATATEIASGFIRMVKRHLLYQIKETKQLTIASVKKQLSSQPSKKTIQLLQKFIKDHGRLPKNIDEKTIKQLTKSVFANYMQLRQELYMKIKSIGTRALME